MKFTCAILWLLTSLLTSDAAPLKVASFSTVTTELAQKIGGEHAQVENLIPPDTDPHEYQPTPAALRSVSQAQLILTPGKQLGGYLDKLQQASGGRATLLAVGDRLDPLPATDEEGRADPHWWHSVANVERAAELIRDELIQLDPGHAPDYQSKAMSCLADLRQLDQWIKRKVAELPRNKRKLVTSHDAFQYFAREYGFQVYAIEGISTEAEPSSRHVSTLIEEIKAQGVKAIFLESTLNPKVVQEITRESGATIGGTLYADGLGEGDAASYSGMMIHNVSTIVDALK